MNTDVFFLISQSILFPLAIGIAKLPRVWNGYRPLFLTLVLGVIIEIINYIVIRNHKSNAIVVNVYVLMECLLLIWQFYEWGLFKKNRQRFTGLLVFFIIIWSIENIVFRQLFVFGPYFRFSYSLLIVMLSVNEINYMITHYNRNLFRNPRFLVCLAFIVFFIYKIIYEGAYQVSLFGKSEFTTVIQYLFAYINALCNLIYALAFILIPRIQKFSLD